MDHKKNKINMHFEMQWVKENTNALNLHKSQVLVIQN